LDLGFALQGYQYTGAQGLTPTGPPTRTLIDQGFKLGMGTDATNVSPFTPWLQMSYMVHGTNNAGQVINPGQGASRLEVLEMYTSGTAYKLKEDTKMGSLETGKFADVAVLTGDPFKVTDDQFRLLRSQLTILDGHVVHQSDKFAKLAV
jgi:predicted amidohydrolase YtcJ